MRRRRGNDLSMRRARDMREARAVRANGRSDDANAFVRDPGDGPSVVSDDLAEALAEEFVQAATTGEEVGEDVRDQLVDEEVGGPFVETTAGDEFASGTDPSNPEDATSEPLPRAVSGLTEKPPED